MRGTPQPAEASPALYAIVRSLLRPLLHTWFRLRITGAEHVPADGPAIIAPNHKSFMDAFFVAMATRRPVRYMAKAELFRPPLGALLARLGAFPVRRGEGDTGAMESAEAILRRGGLVAIFPEGTRIQDPDAIGSPRHGAGRLAVATGAPIVPAAIAGTQHLWLGPVAKPRRVQVAFGAPIVIPPDATADAARQLVDEELWPTVREEYGRLRARPGLILTALTALGVGGGLLARRRARATPRLLGRVPPLRARRRRPPWRRLRR
jgi:1-acyl-sn-glycerol-3-phosphate acyltransferase